MPRTAMTISIMLSLAVCLASSVTPQAQQPQALQLETTVPLGDVRGRIDHMAIDIPRQRLFVAELGNDSLGVVDVKEHKVVHRISGLREPQGIGYVAANDTLYIANGGDGSLRLFTGAQYADAGSLSLGRDADNVRIDGSGNRVVVGYGNGALAVIDAATGRRAGDIRLKGHPESFQLSRDGSRAFVNIPTAHEIAVADVRAVRQIAAWPMRFGANFPMTLDEEAGRLLSVFRSPARVGVFSLQDGNLVATSESCGDADDIFIDAARHRAYVSCGSGALDVIDTLDSAYPRIARIPTVAGARTALFAPELDRLFLAVRAQRGEAASIRIYRPSP